MSAPCRDALGAELEHYPPRHCQPNPMRVDLRWIFRAWRGGRIVL